MTSSHAIRIRYKRMMIWVTRTTSARLSGFSFQQTLFFNWKYSTPRIQSTTDISDNQTNALPSWEKDSCCYHGLFSTTLIESRLKKLTKRNTKISTNWKRFIPMACKLIWNFSPYSILTFSAKCQFSLGCIIRLPFSDWFIKLSGKRFGFSQRARVCPVQDTPKFLQFVLEWGPCESIPVFKRKTIVLYLALQVHQRHYPLKIIWREQFKWNWTKLYSKQILCRYYI